MDRSPIVDRSFNWRGARGVRKRPRGALYRDPLTGYLYILLAAALWALIGPVSRVALRDGVAPLEIAFWRCLVAWALFVVHAGVLALRARGGVGPPRRIARRDLGGIAAFGIVGVAVLYATVPLAVRDGGAALASVLLYTAPTWVALLAWALLGERITGRKILALALTLAGIGGIALSGSAGMRPSAGALLWGLASGLSYASLYLFGKRYFARYPPTTVFLYALPVAGLALLPLTPFGTKTPGAWLALLALGSLSTYGAYLAYGAGLARLEAVRAATAATAEPVLAALLAYLFWDERFTLTGYLACGLIIAGVLVMATAPADAAGGDGPPGP